MVVEGPKGLTFLTPRGKGDHKSFTRKVSERQVIHHVYVKYIYHQVNYSFGLMIAKIYITDVH